ncbi:MAG: ubiquinol-cytochrome c reductase iron-sulfur subunit [Gammaproteobacteria bacterium]|nr:ubiquinol-cytochrome c reductase iron-sulfur subunit [Gammaproteobacteria bacterium]
MSKEGVDLGRRRFLTATASVVGGAGAVAAAIPFVSYMMPSARARAAGAPVEADISKLEFGQLMRVKWRGQPVWVLRRSRESLDELASLNDILADPDSNVEDMQPAYAKNATRSIKPEYLIAVGICTHLGCSPTYVEKIAADTYNLGDEWKGGFFCPCHGSTFDLAGRVYAGVPAQNNLKIPPHRYLGDTVVLIGEDNTGAA